MKVEFVHKPSNTAAKLTLDSGETITSEAGSMIAMSGDMSITTTTHKKNSSGGILGAFKRLLAGESFFLNEFTAGSKGGELYLSTSLAGDMNEFETKGETLIVQASSFVACEEGVKLDVGWQGFKNLLSGESFFWLKLSGNGKYILNTFGMMYHIDIDGEYIVDTGHIVAFSETLNFTISKSSRSIIGSFLSGEGFVCRFRGKGRIWCQSHNPNSFGKELGPYLKPRQE
jgi:uncharacterized protein (TIGR00266 family)